MNDNPVSPTACVVQSKFCNNIKNEVGNRHGRLVVLRREGRNICGQVTWRCKCDCGNETVQAGSALRAGTVVSCGCYHSEVSAKIHLTHGLSNSPIYQCHKLMVSRCTNPNDIGWTNYGGRGIKVCERWMRVENFYEDMAPSWKPGLSIDRIDVNGNYCPENCRWATDSEQNLNKRNTVRYEYNGQMLTKTQLARMAGMSTPALRGRMKLGWPLEKIMTRPLQKKRPRKSVAPTQ